MENKPKWTFLTNHGHVLVYLAKSRDVTTRKIAQEVGVTERAIQKVIHDLEAEGYINRQKVGRNNRYTINPEMPLRHPMEREHAVNNLLWALCSNHENLSKANGEKTETA